MPPPPLAGAPRESFNAESDLLDMKDSLRRMADGPTSGKKAVDLEKQLTAMKEQVAVSKEDESSMKEAGGKTFHLKDDVWVDTAFDEKSSPKVEEITFGSKEYFDLLKTPGLSKFLAVGRQVLFVFNNHTYKITFKENA